RRDAQREKLREKSGRIDRARRTIVGEIGRSLSPRTENDDRHSVRAEVLGGNVVGNRSGPHAVDRNEDVPVANARAGGGRSFERAKDRESLQRLRESEEGLTGNHRSPFRVWGDAPYPTRSAARLRLPPKAGLGAEGQTCRSFSTSA